MSSRRQFVSKLSHAYELSYIPRVRELVKICSIASAIGAKVFPHGHGIHTALHVVASQSPEFVNVAHKMHFQKEPLLTSSGVLTLPGKPSFGIELDKSKIQKAEII